MAFKLPPSLQQKYDRLTAGQKQAVLYGGIVAALAGGLFLFGDNNPQPIKPSAGQPKAVLTDANTRSLGIDTVAARSARTQSEVDRLSRDIALLQDQLAQGRKNDEGRVQEDVSLMKNQLRDELLEELKTQLPPPAPVGQDPTAPAPNIPTDPFGAQSGVPTSTLQGSQIGGSLNGLPPLTPASPAGFAPGALTPPTTPAFTNGNAPQSSPTSSIRTIRTDAKPAEKAAEEKKLAAVEQVVDIPAGSIITGTLLTGMDAPTSKNARSEPYPILMRVDTVSILPSRRTLDLTEAFLIAGGFGDLSSERVYLRADTLSMIRPDGKPIEKALQAWGNGEDGKSGIRGRLISRQGALVARALAAGVAEGFSSVFRKAAVPVVATSSGGSAQFQNLLSESSLQSGTAAGVGKALDRLSEYYLDLADQMHQVVEVDAGRKVDFVLLKGIQIPDPYAEAQ